jgi:aspartyl-tRNA synthetase
VTSNRYRSHTCAVLRPEHISQSVRLAGWVHRKRDHGSLLFIDLRDHYGVTQCVFTPNSAAFAAAEAVRLESVISVSGTVIERTQENINPALPTGGIEVKVESLDVLSTAELLPFQVAGTQEIPEEQRLRYRFLDLRREKIHANIVLRSKVISSIRRRMQEQGFLEFQTPILTSSSPEGARDYLVPSRIHEGRFYALPQAPQQFKQLLMVAGFDRYFQIAPCFRDEDARADRSPGEFYQLDVELSFVTQDDVFGAIEPVLAGVFQEFSDWTVTPPPFPRIAYDDAMLMYGSDKPDLRNPIRAADVTEIFRGSEFAVFAKAVEDGSFARPAQARSHAAFSTRRSAWPKRSASEGWRISSPRRHRRVRSRSICRRNGGRAFLRPPASSEAMRSSLYPAPRRRCRARSTASAITWQRSWDCSRRTRTGSAGSRIFPSSSMTRKRSRSRSATIRFRCRRADSKR